MRKRMTLTEEAIKMQKLSGIVDTESGESLLNENLEVNPVVEAAVEVPTFKKGDLVWAQNEGHAGLTGLVVSDHPNQKGEIDVYFRGWNGDVIPMNPIELKELKGELLSVADKKGDLVHYPAIAKKLGIVLNPIYHEIANAEEEMHDKEEELNIDETSTVATTAKPEVSENEESDKIGINLRSLLDGELAIAMRSADFNNYEERNNFISKIEKRLEENDWISMSNGTTFEKSFTPGKKISEDLNATLATPASEVAKKPEVWYQADYYDIQGGHGAMNGHSSDFNAELKKALELYKREKRANELGKTTGYIGVNGSGDEFAILYIDQNYYNTMDPKHFKSQQAYEMWMKMAKKVLETGKPQKGIYPAQA